MNIFIYMFGGALLMHAVHICHSAVERGPAALPMNMRLFNTLYALAIVALILAVLTGFFRFPWYEPLVGYLVVAPVGSLVLARFVRSREPVPSATLFLLLGGIAIGFAFA